MLRRRNNINSTTDRFAELGAHMLEAACILPVVLVLFAGIADFSRAYLALTTFKQKVSEQSRTAGLTVFTTADTSQQKTANESTLLTNLNGVSGISSPSATVTFDALNTQAIDKMVTVSASAKFNFVILKMIGLKSITFKDTVKSRLEWQQTKPASG